MNISDCCASSIHYSAKNIRLNHLVDWLIPWLIDWRLDISDCLTWPDWTVVVKRFSWIARSYHLRKYEQVCILATIKRKPLWKKLVKAIDIKMYPPPHLFRRHKFVCGKNTISTVPTNIFWVFFTLLFNQTHPNRDSTSKPLYKFCQNQCNAIWTSLRYLKLTRFGLWFSFIHHSFPATLTQGLYLVLSQHFQ